MTGRLVFLTQEQRNAFWNAADDLRIEHGPNPISDALYQATEAWDAALGIDIDWDILDD